jgi:hypothetical protein
VTNPSFAYLADVAIAYARTADHGKQVGLDAAEVRIAIGERLAIDAQAGRATDWTLLCDHLTALADEKSRKERAMADTDEKHPDHDCPGGCGCSMPHRLLACRNCWFLLPADQRNAITRARGGRRLQLVGEAIGWYRENVHNGELVADQSEPAPRFTIADRFGGFPRGGRP